jgi:hypothetical protein
MGSYQIEESIAFYSCCNFHRLRPVSNTRIELFPFQAKCRQFIFGLGSLEISCLN